MSMSIYIPYFYIIQHIKTGQYYAGVKYGINSNPKNLLKPNGYHTSSDIIKQIILEEGIESFVIRKIKVFETGEEALDHESRFLRRVNAAFNDNFLNRSNNSISSLNTDYEKKKQTCLKKYGFEHPNQSPKLKEKYKQKCLEKYGFDCTFKIPEVVDANLKIVKEKYNVLEDANINNVFQIEEIKQKIKEKMIINHGVTHPSKRVKQCSYCGEIKNIQHEAVCQMNKNRKMPNVSGENNGRAITFIIKSPENEEYEIKLHSGVREFCKQRALKIYPFMKNKIPGWNICIKEKV